MRIESKDLISTLKKWQREEDPRAGLKESALLQKVINEVNRMAANEEIKTRIAIADMTEGTNIGMGGG